MGSGVDAVDVYGGVIAFVEDPDYAKRRRRRGWCLPGPRKYKEAFQVSSSRKVFIPRRVATSKDLSNTDKRSPIACESYGWGNQVNAKVYILMVESGTIVERCNGIFWRQ